MGPGFAVLHSELDSAAPSANEYRPVGKRAIAHVQPLVRVIRPYIRLIDFYGLRSYQLHTANPI